MDSRAENPPFYDKAPAPGLGGSSSMAPPVANEGVQAGPFNFNNPTEELSKDDKFFGIFIISLRALQILFSLIGFIVAVPIRRAFNDKSFTVVLCLDVIVCLYAIIMLTLSLIHYSSTRKFLSPPTWEAAKLTFVLDQVLAYALLGAACNIAILFDPLAGVRYFPGKINVLILVSLLAFVFLAASAALYPVRLLKVTKRK